MRIKRARGRSPGGGGPFDLSVTARTPMSRIAVPRNSEKKQAAIVMSKNKTKQLGEGNSKRFGGEITNPHRSGDNPMHRW
jgi:hypothetical protein